MADLNKKQTREQKQGNALKNTTPADRVKNK